MWFCKSNDHIIQDNRQYYVKTLSFLVEHIETWRNIYCLLHSNFKRTSVDGIAEDTAVRDQVIIWSEEKKMHVKRNWKGFGT